MKYHDFADLGARSLARAKALDPAEVLMDLTLRALAGVQVTPSVAPHLEREDELEHIWRALAKYKDSKP